MRKITYSLLSLFICTAIMAQTNTFPTTGNVGIGTTSPNYKAEILSGALGLSGGSETFLEFNSIYSAADYKKWRMAIGGGVSAFSLTTRYDNGSKKGDIFNITNSGNFGIGTTSPNDLLHISKSGANTRLRIGNNSAYDQLLYFNGSADWSMGMDNSNSNAFTIASTSSLDNSQRFTILSNGDTGIGTTSPTSKLHIEGDVFIKSGEKLQWGGPQTFIEGSTVSNKIALFTNSLERFRVDDGGNVGIGTTSPWAPLSLGTVSNALYEEGVSLAFEGGSFNQIGYRFKANGSNYYQVLYNGTAIEWKHYTGSSGYETRMALSNSGNLGIGTTTPGEKLEVNGNALIDGELYSKKVKVSVNPGNWPDYVFASSYELRALSDVESFVKKNGHLPEVPSAAAIEKEGLDLGNMDATLLQKVEELTLYLIDINKKQEELIKEVQSLKKENEALKKKVKEQ